ncbi:MAG: spore cortex biosynthesis protein YabQ [Clostridiales bacterium]|nr:spore cortex biosynthesis protein YabQ [Clostridiales bacterium]HBM79468.1 spore cortex biosynthesis protein YabQ [Clostridiaceae bacterium]
MLSTLQVQFMSLLLSIFAGIAIGLLFDMYRTINYYTKPSRVFLSFMDLLFWLITGCMVFSILLRADFAALRFYTFAGMCFGVFIYLKLFSEYILKLYRGIIYIIIRIVHIFYIFALIPFKLLYNLFWGPANGTKKFFKKSFSNIVRKRFGKNKEGGRP